MQAYNEVAAVYNALCGAENLGGAAVIMAYPFADKPVRPERAVIAVSPGEVELSPVSVGYGGHYGTVKVKADVYAPPKLGANAVLSAAHGAALAVLDLYPTGISISPLTADERLDCLHCGCAFTFSRYFESETE